MMLSELYGRIGQQLQEHGDAEIMRPPMPNEAFRSDSVYSKTKVRFILKRDYIGKAMVDKKYILEFK